MLGKCCSEMEVLLAMPYDGQEQMPYIYKVMNVPTCCGVCLSSYLKYPSLA